MPRFALAALPLLAGCHWLFAHDPAPPRGDLARLADRSPSIDSAADRAAVDRPATDQRADPLPLDARVFANVRTIATGLGEPHGVAVAASGEVYVADYKAGTVWFLGTPSVVLASNLSSPTSVALSGGELYVAEFSGGCVVRISLQGSKEKFLCNLDHPDDVVFDSAATGYIAEFSSGKVLRLPSGAKNAVELVPGAKFGSPHLFALDEPRKRLYVTEWGSHQVASVDLTGGTVSRLPNTFTTPGGIALDGGRQLLYVSERDKHQIRVIDLGSGKDSVLTGGIEGYADGPLASARFNSPEGLALGVDGRLYVAEFYGGRVRVIE